MPLLVLDAGNALFKGATLSGEANEKARAEQLIADARSAIQEQAGLDRVRPLAADLQQIIHGLPTSAAASSPHGGGNGRAAEETAAEEEEEVIDAEFTRD